VILDITAVPVVDTAVAKHLLETVSAARLLGAEVLIVGLSTRTALTLVHLGLDLAGVTTRTTMAKGLELAFARLGLEVVARRATPTRGDVAELGL
jgi:rsbT co-antagonist protein RsbR